MMVVARNTMIAGAVIFALNACDSGQNPDPIIINSGSLTQITLPALPTNEHEAWWCANLKTELISDGVLLPIQNLEIIVHVIDDTPVLDSVPLGTYNDDSIEIFIDANNSKGLNYDGFDDYQLIFTPFETGIFNIEQGPPMAPENLNGVFEYFTNGYQLTATIPLREFGINNGLPFGLNIQVNDDDDGEPRDSAHSWIATEGRDLSFLNSSSFGTAQVPKSLNSPT